MVASRQPTPTVKNSRWLWLSSAASRGRHMRIKNVRRNNIVLINGLLAQDTVRVEGWEPGSALTLFAGVDSDDPQRGGRHFILVVGEKAQVTCSYLAAAEGAPLKVAVVGS